MQGPEVEYSLRLFPLGGYVAFPDDDPTNSKYPADDPNLLKNRSIPERTAVISAGIIANFIFAYLVLLAQVRVHGRMHGRTHVAGCGGRNATCSAVLGVACWGWHAGVGCFPPRGGGAGSFH